jgi:GrpB-like predicted nucleotidyltransferase (UPF0157 family)
MPRVTIADYDPGWPGQFAQESDRIRTLLGPRALRIEHVGSTSVSGLAAKPVIDILLVVADSADEAGYMPSLESAGYRVVIREPDWHQHRMLKGPDADINLHVFSADCPEIDRMLAFRDWLRGNAADRTLYEQTKRDLARSEWADVQNYADAKTGIVGEIMRRIAQQPSRSPDRPSPNPAGS